MQDKLDYIQDITTVPLDFVSAKFGAHNVPNDNDIDELREMVFEWLVDAGLSHLVGHTEIVDLEGPDGWPTVQYTMGVEVLDQFLAAYAVMESNG